MSVWYEPNAEQRRTWAEWLATRPEHVRIVAERFAPWTMWRHRPTGVRARVISFTEIRHDCGEHKRGDVALRMRVISGRFSLPIAFAAPCQLPDGFEVAELTGVLQSEVEPWEAPERSRASPRRTE